MIAVILRGLLALAAICTCLIWAARAEDNPGAWWQTPAVRACCSESDAVYADVWQIMPDGSIRATVTGGGPRSHAWAPVGKVYEIPADKILREPGNPTGRALLFIRQGDLHLYCFAMGPLI